MSNRHIVPLLLAGALALAFGWTPAAPGAYELRVRAYDLNGAAQTDRVQPNFPSGATGLHHVVVSVA
jgi:hypothetical protein